MPFWAIFAVNSYIFSSNSWKCLNLLWDGIRSKFIWKFKKKNLDLKNPRSPDAPPSRNWKKTLDLICQNFPHYRIQIQQVFRICL